MMQDIYNFIDSLPMWKLALAAVYVLGITWLAWEAYNAPVMEDDNDL